MVAVAFALVALAVAGVWLWSGRSDVARAGPAPTPTPSTVVRTDPLSKTATLGTEHSVDIVVAGIADPDGLGGYEFALEFDPALLVFSSFTNGPFLGSTGRAVICLPPDLDRDDDGTNDTGFVRIGCATLAPSPSGPVGGGLLATLTFATLATGTSPKTFDAVGLADPLGGDIPARAENGSVTIGSAQLLGDVNCDGDIDAIDAALILQLSAGLIDSLPCFQSADVNDDGEVNAIDAAIVLQYVAGLIDSIPP